MSEHQPIVDADLHAYVDGELSPERRAAVEAHLRTHPEAARQVQDHKRIDLALHRLYDPVLYDPVPERFLSRPVRPVRRRWLAAAAALAWMSLGAVLGWSLQPGLRAQLAGSPQPHEAPHEERQDRVRPDLVQPAAFAHAVYTTDARRPVEIGAAQEEQLTAWLSKRLHGDIRAPNLAPQGWRLMGGRLLPSTNRMAAQFMYERDDGLRVTLYIRQGAWGDETSEIRFGREDDLGVLYWIDGPRGYALSGDLGRAELQALAETVHQQQQRVQTLRQG